MTHPRRSAVCLFLAFAAPLTLAGALAGSQPASAVATAAAACKGWKAVRPPDPGAATDDLFGVIVLSASNAWAVGDISNQSGGTDPFKTLIEHWNGHAWKTVPSPSPSGGGDLLGVSATSASNAWAVGQATVTSTGTAFELHWNGHTWSNMASPTPGDTSAMFAVAASSASEAWAVGEFTPDPQGATHRTLAFHC